MPEQHLGQRIDIGLSDAGRDQADALGRRLVGVEFARILSSPLVRARETASILRAAIPDPPEIEVDPRLAEMDYGDWEGLTYDEIDERDAAERARWEDDPATIACPGGESGTDVALRAEAFLVDLIAWHDALSGQPHERPILAVAHSSLNRVMICVATGIPVREYRRRFSQDQTNLTVLRFEHGVGPADARILLLNDTAHLHPQGTVPWD